MYSKKHSRVPALMPRRLVTLSAFCLAATSLFATPPAGRSDGSPAEPEFPLTGEYSNRGADSCIPCHQDSMPLSAMALFDTPHGARTDPAAPFGQLQCETCHGPGKDHARSQRGGGDVRPTIVFGQRASTPPSEQNAVCLGCHQNHGRLGWFGSMHEAQDLSCTACHQIHRSRDGVFDALAQQQACFGCHQRREGDIYRTSNHPLRFGSMACSSCHDPHNGNNEALLREATVNQTCYICHAEKRGPFVWEHAPASEDCTLCHRPHGSNHPAMLIKRPPLLCQQCHSPAGHPGVAYTPELANDELNNRFMLGRACLNCHSQVHGSNHPSGATLHR
jgi:DmsE family decaheme c-type cytochrome